jgi:sigma-B regulation protein RsbU (phosphoserine phosphatase)
VAASAVILVSYEVVAIFWQHILSVRDGSLAFVNNNFFYASANVLGATACYYLEAFARRDFFQRRAIEAEMESAREVQRSFLPRTFPGIPELDIAGACRPARQVGGDYFDVLPAGPGCWLLIIADVSGKGAPAALLMANLHALIRVLPSPSPATLAAAINAHVHNVCAQSNFVTAIVALIDVRERRLSYVNGGHCGGILLGADSTAVTLASTGFPFGLFADSTYDELTIRFQPGSTIFLFTDGLAEREDAGGNAFGEDGLLQAALRHRSSPASELLNQTFREADRFSGGLDLADDSTILIVQYREQKDQPAGKVLLHAAEGSVCQSQ